jgi:hypothetical protein
MLPMAKARGFLNIILGSPARIGMDIAIVFRIYRL